MNTLESPLQMIMKMRELETGQSMTDGARGSHLKGDNQLRNVFSENHLQSSIAQGYTRKPSTDGHIHERTHHMYFTEVTQGAAHLKLTKIP
jgi:hypothetical protein